MNTKIFIINLKNQIDRKTKMEAQLKASGISNYEFFPAIDGATLRLEPIPMSINFDRKHLGEEYRKHFSPNEIGCLKSHIEVLKKAKELDLDYVTILEDDIIICADWESRLERLLRITPKNWNHLYLSGEPNESELLSKQYIKPINFAPFLHVEKSVDTMGAFSYIIRNDIYDLLIEKLASLTLPVDDVVKELKKTGEIKSYTLYPFFSYHDNDIPSTIWSEKIWKQEYSVNHNSKSYYVRKI